MNRKIISLASACLLMASASSCGYKKTQVAYEVPVKTYTGFFAAAGSEISDDNRIQGIIAEKTGAKCDETWVSEGDNFEDIVNRMIIDMDYPDFIYTGQETTKFLEAEALIPLEGYIDKNENLKNYFTEDEWNRVRSSDGHIYYIPVFSKVYGNDTETIHNDEAFWIQARVLKWNGYRPIKTLDEYFDLIEGYLAANPVDENDEPYIGYEILTDGYLYFCLENPPQFLDGYPNDGSCIVNRNTNTVIDYNTTPTAKKWFEKLNEEYRRGVIDKECFTMTANQYYEKLKSGNVLGMVDQRWNFGPYVENLIDECSYIPLEITIDSSIRGHYHSETAFDSSQGIGISVSCKDPDGAAQFMNDLLSPEILNLRMWGEEDIDYKVGNDGIFYLTDQQSGLLEDEEYRFSNRCGYEYFPFYKGMNTDGKNAYSPEYQPSEFYRKLSGIMKECLDAYGARTFVQLFNEPEQNAPWYPMWSYTNTFTSDTPYGKVMEDITEVKHRYLPKVVMSTNFEKSWSEYMEAYSKCSPEVYINELQNEVSRRLAK